MKPTIAKKLPIGPSNNLVAPTLENLISFRDVRNFSPASNNKALCHCSLVDKLFTYAFNCEMGTQFSAINETYQHNDIDSFIKATRLIGGRSGNESIRLNAKFLANQGIKGKTSGPTHEIFS